MNDNWVHSRVKPGEGAKAPAEKPLLRKVPLLVLLVLQFAASLASSPQARAGAFEQLQSLGGGGSVYIPMPGNPECVSGCEGSDSGGGGDQEGGGNRGIWGAIDRWQEEREEAQRQEAQRRQQEEQRKRQEAFSLNEQGNRAYEKGEWATAVDLYRRALANSPNDKVIQENLRRAEREKQRLEELRREQSEYRRRMGQLVAVMPVAKPLAREVKAPRPTVPPPGFTSEQWKEYLAAEDTVALLYGKLNRDGALSDADSAAFYSALRRRNGLWAAAMEQPRSDDERDRLRLSLPRVVGKGLLNAVMGMFQGGKEGDHGSAPAVKSPDRRLLSPSDRNVGADDPISTAFAADFFADKAAERLESEVGDAIEEVHGEKIKGRYEKMLTVGKIGVRAMEGGVPAVGAETADLLISMMPEPTSARAELAVEGGRIYSKVVYQALNRFMTDAMNATGAAFDSEAFWKSFNDDLTASQKGVKEWVEFGE
uniref:TPR domain protein n=1 Tax=Geobacter metallireducens TaxID=28232 RepID=A0A831UDR4_GEOME